MSDILIFCATTGNNLKISEKIGDILTDKKQSFKLVNLSESPLPLYTPQKQSEGISDEIKLITSMAQAAKGFIFVGPEYNGSIPPVFNNVIAWISVSGDKDWRAAFNGKFSLLATHSGGMGQKYYQAMSQQLNHIGSIVLPRYISAHAKKPYNPDSAQIIVEQFLGCLK